MLNVFREGAKTWASQFLIWFVALTFVGAAFLVWGRGSRQNEEIVAVVNDNNITRKQFTQRIQRVEETLRRQFQGQMNTEVMDMMNPPAMAMNSLIENSLQLHAAAESGLVVTDKELMDVIQNMQEFKYAGAFDRMRYMESLQRNGIAPKDFESDMRSDILIGKLRALVEGSVYVSDAEVRNQYIYDNEPVVVEFVKVNAAPLEKKIKTGDDELKKWYEGHKSEFQIPETRSFKLLTVGEDSFAGDVTATDDEIENYYEANSAEFASKEEVHARHILAQVSRYASDKEVAAAKEKVEKAAARVKKGEDFAEVAKEMSEGPSAESGGDLGTFAKGAMVPEFEKVAFSLKPNEVSKPFRTEFGWHIVQVLSHTEKRTPPLNEIRDKVAEKVKEKKARAAAMEFMKKLAASVKPDGFDAAAKEHPRLKVEGYTAAKGEPIVTLADSDAVESVVFGLPEKTVSDVIEMRKELALAVVEAVQAPNIPPFEKIKDKVEKRYRDTQSMIMAENLAKKIAGKVNEGASLADAAKGEGFAVEKTPSFSRVSLKAMSTSDKSEGMVKDVFGLKTGAAKVAPAMFDYGYLVLTVASRLPVDDKEYGEQAPQIRQMIMSNKKSQIYSDFLANLRQRAEEQGLVKVNIEIKSKKPPAPKA